MKIDRVWAMLTGRPGSRQAQNEESEENSSPASVAFDWARSLLGTLAFVLVFTSFVAQGSEIPSESMKPTILVGDHFVIDKVAFPANYPGFVNRFLPERRIDRGEIIVFKSQRGEPINLIKRVIGLPGEEIEIRDKTVYINGKRLDEPYKRFIDPAVFRRDEGMPDEEVARDNFGPFRIPEGSYFVMGDNRDDSYDSRFWGTVPKKDIVGKPLANFIYWSYDRKPYTPEARPFSEALKELGSTAVHFFSKTRWDRTGSRIK